MFFGFCCAGYKGITTAQKMFAGEISTESVYMILYVISMVIPPSLSMGTLLVASQFKWKKLWKKLKEVEHFSYFTVDDCNKIRKVAITLIVVAILQVCIVYQ